MNCLTEPFTKKRLIWMYSEASMRDKVWVPFTSITYLCYKTGKVGIIRNISIALEPAKKWSLLREENERVIANTICFFTDDNIAYRLISKINNL